MVGHILQPGRIPNAAGVQSSFTVPGTVSCIENQARHITRKIAKTLGYAKESALDT
jgi:hypothetical protein